MRVSKSQLAEHLGVSRGRISQLIGTGLPVMPDDRVDLADACRWVVQHLRPDAQGAVAVRQAWQILDWLRMTSAELEAAIEKACGPFARSHGSED